MRAAFVSITPMVPAGEDLAAALRFYTERMGFSILWQGGGGAGIGRDGVHINLVENGNREWSGNASFSIGVSGLYEEYRDLPARVGPLEIKPWGRREFHMIVPSGVCLQFYEVAPTIR